MQNEHANLNEEPLPDAAVESLPPADAQDDETLGAATQMAGGNAFAVDVTIDVAEAKRALEAALLAASEPMALNELKKIFDGELSADIVRNLVDELRTEWAGRSVELALVASGYRFRIKPDYQKYIDRLSNEKPPRYSRAVLETMAIIAYRQPVTRGDIEDIRGVAVSPHILKTLEDRGWIDEIGHKDAPGRPALFATTKHFLDDLNLSSLDELPPLHELQATLDMSQAGAALSAGVPFAGTPSLPGVETVAGVDMPKGDAAAAADATADDTADAGDIEPSVTMHDNQQDTDQNLPAMPHSADTTGASS